MTIRKFRNEKELNDHIADHPNTVYILDFWADWCGPCKSIAPEFESISNQEQFRNVYFVKIDVEDENFENIVNSLNVKSLPTFVTLSYNPGNSSIQILAKNKGADREKILHMLHYSLEKITSSE